MRPRLRWLWPASGLLAAGTAGYGLGAGLAGSWWGVVVPTSFSLVVWWMLALTTRQLRTVVKLTEYRVHVETLDEIRLRLARGESLTNGWLAGFTAYTMALHRELQRLARRGPRSKP